MLGSRKLVSIGHYRLKPKHLGKGSFASVELATHVIFPKDVALKVIVKKEIKDPYMTRNLTREAYILSKLDHPNVVKLIEVLESPEIYCIALEYAASGSLLDIIHTRGRLHEKSARNICRQVASALFYLHTNKVIHRDLKMDNILMDKKRAILVDFGLSSSWYQGQKMKTHCGSPEYAAPELFWKVENYGPSVDIWSFGIVLYGLVLGHLPFKSGSSASDKKSTSLIKRITRGLTFQQIEEMEILSFELRILLFKCLNVDMETRILSDKLCADPWLNKDEDVPTQHPSLAPADNLAIANDLKRLLKTDKSVEEILDHVKKSRFRTTAGIFNLLSLDLHSAKRRTEESSKNIRQSAKKSVHPSVEPSKPPDDATWKRETISNKENIAPRLRRIDTSKLPQRHRQPLIDVSNDRGNACDVTRRPSRKIRNMEENKTGCIEKKTRLERRNKDPKTTKQSLR